MRFRKFIGALLAAASFSAVAAIPTTETTEIVEFYHAALDHYFITLGPKEIQDLDSGVHPGWTRTGYRFLVVKNGSGYAGSVPVCRFYGRPEKGIDSHFYSAKASECEDVKNKFPDAWMFETAEAFRAFPVNVDGSCPADTAPVYRLWNQRADVNHRYTDQLSVYQFMVSKGYKPEGDGDPQLPVAFCAVAGGSVVPPPAADAPSCTVTASSGAPPPGSTLTLTAQCSNNPTGYMWTGCSSTTNTCQATQPVVGQASYTVYTSNSKGPAAPVTMKVNWGGVAGNMPICQISASAASLPTGTPLVLGASCSQSPTKYEWYECNYLIQSICNPMPACATATTSCTVNSSQVGFARYAVAASNATGLGPKVAVDVEWRSGTVTPPPGGGGGGGNDPIPSCTVLTSNSSPVINTNIVLSANCTGNPTAYYWTGITCSGVQCQATSSTPGTHTYSVSASNATGTGGIAYLAIDWQSSSSPTPACTLSASNPSPATGSTITILSSCTNSPTTYNWTGCSSTGPSCTDTLSVAGQKEYTLVASNASGAGNTASVTVQWTGPVTTPPVCSIAASSSQPTVGQNLTLTATCNGSPTAYVWTNCASTTSSCVATAAAAGQVTYYVAGTNGFGTGAAAGVVVNWAPAGGGGGGADFCGSYNNVLRTSVSWGDISRITTAGLGGFSSDGVLVMSMTVPTSPSSYGQAGYTSLAEYGGPPALRHMTLSTAACDFRPYDPTGVNGPFGISYGKQVTIDWNVGTPPMSLVPGQTYHFSIRNTDFDGKIDCTQNFCDASISTNWPR